MKKLFSVQTQIFASLITLLLVLSTSLIFAQAPTTIPGKISYQGKLLENNLPVTGSRNIEFSIPGTGWTETHTGVQVSKGLYSVQLGSITTIPVTVFNSPTVTLEIAVEGTTLSPQVELLSVPYAYKADDAKTVNGLTVETAVPAGAVFTDIQLTEAQVDDYVANNGYLTSEVDGSTSNEIQDLSLNTTTNILTITGNGTATEIELSPYLDNTDTQLTETEVDGYVANNGYLTTDANNQNITNLADPVNAQDAATKAYVDALIDQLYDAGVLLSVRDIDGNVYQTIQIGNQIWMAENLKTTRYANGEEIPDGTNAGNILEENNPKYWFAYDNNLNNVTTYGRLYTWYTTTDNRSLCPTGWHVPTDAEWKELEMYLGMSQSAADAIGWRGTNEGGKLKELGTAHWNSPNIGATNETGFTALPGGLRDYLGGFYYGGNDAYWWSATEHNTTSLWSRYMVYFYSYIGRNLSHKKFGFSVRCVKNN